MFRFLCFAVTVAPGGRDVGVRQPTQAAFYCEAPDYDQAFMQAQNHIALHVGESIAVVQTGRILNREAGDTLSLGQASG